jgi:hypothetical protein
MTQPDWRKILRVYISHVRRCEGKDFIPDSYGCLGHLTAEEYEALLTVANEPTMAKKARKG